MENYGFKVELLRFHTKRPNCLVIIGWFRDDNPQGRTICIKLDGQPLKYEQEIRCDYIVRSTYMHHDANVGKEYVLAAELPENWERCRKLQVSSLWNGKEDISLVRSVKRLRRRQRDFAYHIESVVKKNGQLVVSGWFASAGKVEFTAKQGGEALPLQAEEVFREDVNRKYIDGEGEKKCGVILRIPLSKDGKILLIAKDGAKELKIPLQADQEKKSSKVLELLKKTYNFYRLHGFGETLSKIKRKLGRNGAEVSYQEFLKKHPFTPEERKEQKKTVFARNLKFSIVVPLYRTPKEYLTELVRSVQDQTYGNWELCLADGSGNPSPLREVLKELQQEDSRIKVRFLAENMGIAGNTNAALDMAEGDFLVLADHDDLLTEDALFSCAKVLEEDGSVDVIYSDEDKINMQGNRFFEPNFKPDFNLDLLCSMNYICHLFVFSRQMYEKCGGFQTEYDGAQDHDLILRYTEQAAKIHHIPRVLYHWRCHESSTAANPESKLYAYESGKKAVAAHYKRIGIPARVENGPFYGTYHTIYEWETQPLISIIVPNKDHVADLRKCMEAIDGRSVYRNYEWIIVENNSEEEETFSFYKEIGERENVQVVYYEGDFNFSKINNFGEQYAKGEYLLLLNNDTEMMNDDALQEMLFTCMRPDVGIVGARLYYEDNTIQHAGVVIGFGGIAGHTFIGQPMGEPGYMSRIVCAQDYSAVTAACMMVEKKVYEQVGGLTEKFKVAFNDIDFCLKVGETGKRVVYNPYVQFHHYESKSRGMEDTPEKIARFKSEVKEFCGEWEELLRKGDPCYNPNLSLDRSDFGLKL